MSEDRREYLALISLNRRSFSRIIIDPHYEDKHSDITDQVILDLIKLIDGTEQVAVVMLDGFTYIAKDLSWQEKHYRIVLTYCEEDFLGVVNAFRVKEKKQ